MIFSKHRKKIEPKRRFGTRRFKERLREIQTYRRINSARAETFWEKIFFAIGLRSKWWRYSILALIAVTFYFLVLSNYFSVTNFAIAGNKELSNDQIQQVLAVATNGRHWLIPKNNFLFLSTGKINVILTKNLPEIKQVNKVKRKWPNQITVEVVERKPSFVLKSSDQYFLIDDEGTVVKQMDDPEKFLIIEDQVVENFVIGEEFPNPKLIAFIVSMSNSWNTKINTPISLIKIPGKASAEVLFTTVEGWNVLFDVQSPVARQLNNLSLIINKQVASKDRNRLAYIDLRLSKWAYLCFKDSPCQQQEQPEEQTDVPK